MNDGYAWGGGPDLSAWETVMWRTYDDPRTRAHGVFVELLDREPEWDRPVSYTHLDVYKRQVRPLGSSARSSASR